MVVNVVNDSEKLYGASIKTSVLKTIRKPPLAEAQTALAKQNIKYGKKFCQPAMWHVALGS